MVHQANSTGGYLLGILYLIMCGAIWCATAELVQSYYTNYAFECPFLVTYFGSCVFLLHFPLHFFHTRCNKHDQDDADHHLHHHHHHHRVQERDVEAGFVVTNPLHKQDKANRSRNNSKSKKIANSSSSSSHGSALKVAVVLAPVWFVANLCYSYALLLTSVTSSVVISNLAASFALIFSHMAGLEQITKTKIIGIVLAFVGALLVSLQDLEFPSSSSASSHGLGDGMAFLSSIGYGLYLMLLRLLVPAANNEKDTSARTIGTSSNSSKKRRGKRRGDLDQHQQHQQHISTTPTIGTSGNTNASTSAVSMQLVFAYLGLLLSVCLSPVVAAILLLHLDDVYASVLTDNNAELLCLLLLVAYFDQFAADYLWATASTLTSPSVAALGQGITIPLAFFADMALKKEGSGGALAAIGATLICVGFLFANFPSQSSSTSTSLSKAMLPKNGHAPTKHAAVETKKQKKRDKKTEEVENPLHFDAVREKEEQQREQHFAPHMKMNRQQISTTTTNLMAKDGKATKAKGSGEKKMIKQQQQLQQREEVV